MKITKYLDTNVILRLIIKDNHEQLEVIKKLLEQATSKKIKLTTSIISIFETEWVLRSFYKFEKNDILEVLQKILSIGEITFDQRDILDLTIQNMLNNTLGFEDNYHIAYSQFNNLDFFSFDTKALKFFKQLQTK